MIKERPCASKVEIGALFDEFLSLNQPYSDVIVNSSQWSHQPQRAYPQIPQDLTLKSDIVSSAPSSPDSSACIASSPVLRAQEFCPSSPDSFNKSTKRKSTSTDDSKRKKKSRSDDNDSDCVDANKKARRRKQNRVAAQTSREKKKRYLTGLESKVQELSDQNLQLQAQLKAALAENVRLKQGHPQSTPAYVPSFVVKAPPLEPEATLTTTVKKESAIAFESAVFYFPQPSEVMAILFFLLSLMSAICKAPWTVTKSVKQLKTSRIPWTPCVSSPLSTTESPSSSFPSKQTPISLSVPPTCVTRFYRYSWRWRKLQRSFDDPDNPTNTAAAA